MSQYFIDKLVYNNDTLDIHDTEAREMINTNTTNIQAVSARVTKNANDIDALENTTNVIREDLDNVEDRVSVTEAEIDGLNTRTTSLEGKMVTVENRLDGHDTKISGLEARMDTAENNITALDGRMTTAENDIDAAEHRLDLVEAKNNEQDTAIDSLEVNVSKNTADIVDIKADLTGIHTDINDLDDRITASTYEAGIGIYFGQGAEHTNINVEDEILNQINQNTIDIQNLKTRVTNVENRLTVVEGDITNIKADIVNIKGDITDIKAEIVNIKDDIVNIKADITALTVRVTALEKKVLPAGGSTGQVLKKNSSKDYDVVWGYDHHIAVIANKNAIPSTLNFDMKLDGVQSVINEYLPVAVPMSSAETFIKSRCYDEVLGTKYSTVDTTIYPKGDATNSGNFVKLHKGLVSSPSWHTQWELEDMSTVIGRFTVGNGTDTSVVTFTPTLGAEMRTLLSDVCNALPFPTNDHYFKGKYNHTTYNMPSGGNEELESVDSNIHKSGSNIIISSRGMFIPSQDPYVADYQMGIVLFNIVYNLTTDTVTKFEYKWIS